MKFLFQGKAKDLWKITGRKLKVVCECDVPEGCVKADEVLEAVKE